ncbi:unnamed protein product [Linum tenue]|uniref:C2H2-type domain-containing protein n=2 Tax=Linum tenue TaxID=586396 RepID=A0AAV0NWR4_9ROSI|nr:unnamed protein product [Linum tenue]
MEPNQKKKFVCKFCNKRYPCGKSLGGHIRIHQNSNYSTDDVDDEAKAGGYILRENPKKTRRFEGNVNNPGLSLQDKICKECGKGFQSLKALCGHMACHSRNYNYDDQSDTSDKLKDLVMDYQSDTETSTPSKRRRSKRMMRYKNVGLYNSSNGSGSFSSMASGLEQEQEEVARCLMMLSKDSGIKGCLSYVGDSSDNNSVVLEAKSSCLTKMRIRVKSNNNNNGSSCYDEDDDGGGDDDDDNSFMDMKIARKKKQHQPRQVVISSENDDDGGGYDSTNSDSDYFNYGPKKVVESEVVSFHGSTARFGRIHSGFDESYDDGKGKRISGLGVKEMVEQDGTIYDSRKKSSTKIVGSSSAMALQQQRRSNIHHKRGRDDSLYESGENSFENETIPSGKKVIKSSNGGGKNPLGKSSKFLSSAAAAKKVKTHECPFCSKVFKSGQALGGHKRSHFVGAADDATVVIKQQVGLIDLNLPAPVEEEQHHHQQQANNGFVTW